MIPFYRKVTCNKVIGGKRRPLWQARHENYQNVCGAGNTADNAIKDLAEQVRRYNRRVAEERKLAQFLR